MIPMWLLDDPDVSTNAKVLFAQISSYVRPEGAIFPRRDTIAARLGCSPSTLKRAQSELQRLGVLNVETVQTRFGRKNYYRLLVDRFGGTLGSRQGTQESPAVLAQGPPAVLAVEEEEVEVEKTPATKPSASPAGRRSAQPLVAAWVDGHDEAPTQQAIRKFAGHARDLTNELRRRHDTLSSVPDAQWQRAVDTATMLGVTGKVNLTAAYYGQNGDGPLLPENGHYSISDGTAYLW